MKQLRILLITLAVIVLTMSLISCKGKDQTTTTSNTTNGDTTASITTAATTNTTSTTVTTTVATVTTAGTPISSAPVTPLDQATVTAGADGKVTVPTTSSKSGLLLLVNKTTPYACNADKLKTNTEIGAFYTNAADADEYKSELAKLGLTSLYYLKNGNFKVKNATLCLTDDAASAFSSMMESFKKITGKDSVQVVSAYTYAGTASLEDAFVLGTSVKLNNYNGTDTYPLNYATQKITVNGTEMTYLKWFEENCYKFGFIYTGLTDDKNAPLANFRYVGVVHATYITEKELELADYVAAAKKGDLYITMSDTDEWTVKYVDVSDPKLTSVDFALSAGAEYVLSGDNSNGFIIAVKTKSAS